MPYLLVLFIVMPIVEIAVLIQVGGALGLLPTLAIVILTAIIGTRMLRSQGRATFERARQRMGSGEMPASEIVEGMLLLVGGVLLLTPGFVTDAFGFLCLVPASRAWLAARLSARSIGVVVGGMGPGRAGGSGGASGGGPGDAARSGGRMPPGGVPGAGAGVPPRGPVGTAPGRAGQASGDVIEGDFQRLDD